MCVRAAASWSSHSAHDGLMNHFAFTTCTLQIPQICLSERQRDVLIKRRRSRVQHKGARGWPADA